MPRRSAQASPRAGSRLSRNLVLFGFVRSLLGLEAEGDYRALTQLMKTTPNERGPDGQSPYLELLAARVEPALKAALLDYDRNVMAHQAALAQNREGFRLTYFQYLAALFTELYLDRLTRDRTGLLRDLEAYRQSHFPELSPYRDEDLDRLAFWMATGSGKTLLMHLNLLQFCHYRPFEPDNVLLLVPTEALRNQHLRELAKSGFSAAYALEAPSNFNGVLVLELTKLYREGERSPKGGVSLPTSAFSGRNLIFVDESHKGTSGREGKDERAWRAVREDLRREGMEWEYSATFAQITEGKSEVAEELFQDYSRSILFEYSYRRFYEDGYGKDFRVVNLRKGEEHKDLLFLLGLLTFYEQVRYYEDHPEVARAYNLEPPLMTFLGASVTGGDDVKDILRALNRVLAEPDWARESLEGILKGDFLPQGFFLHTFPYLRERGLAQDADALYRDLVQRLFGGRAPLSLHLLKRAEGEIGLRTQDARKEAYFGVVNVGKPEKFLKGLEGEVQRGEDDHLTESLFQALSRNGRLRFLIGSRKFVEGWDSFRVSAMGLMNMGKGAGAQVIQLFGRGVRLRGKDGSLMRSSALPGDHPRHLHLLETLSIFGVQANYLERFEEIIRLEGLPPTETLVLPVEVRKPLPPLQVLEGPSEAGFSERVVVLDPERVPEAALRLDLTPRFGATAGLTPLPVQETSPSFTPFPWDRVDLEVLYRHALAHKVRRGYHNLAVSRKALRALLERARIAAPEEVRDPDRLQRLAESIIERALDRFYYRQREAYEKKRLQPVSLTEDHPNFPKPGYEVRVPRERVAEIKKVVVEAQKMKVHVGEPPLPRLYLDLHLYSPLLVRHRFVLRECGMALGEETDFQTVPTGLVESEARFAADLFCFWREVTGRHEWAGYEVHLLRNLPRRGLGFFAEAGFYPDFLLFLVREGKQVLAFVDPKGLTRFPAEKAQLLAELKTMDVGFPVRGFLVTPTPPASVGALDGLRFTREELKTKGVFFMEEKGYVKGLMEELRRAWEEAYARGAPGR